MIQRLQYINVSVVQLPGMNDMIKDNIQMSYIEKEDHGL
jgi:hypothetical protein